MRAIAVVGALLWVRSSQSFELDAAGSEAGLAPTEDVLAAAQVIETTGDGALRAEVELAPLDANHSGSIRWVLNLGLRSAADLRRGSAADDSSRFAHRRR